MERSPRCTAQVRGRWQCGAIWRQGCLLGPGVGAAGKGCWQLQSGWHLPDAESGPVVRHRLLHAAAGLRHSTATQFCTTNAKRPGGPHRHLPQLEKAEKGHMTALQRQPTTVGCLRGAAWACFTFK